MAEPNLAAMSAPAVTAVGLMTIVGMLGLMFWLNWDFALIAVGVTPFLLLFVARFKKSVKDTTRKALVDTDVDVTDSTLAFELTHEKSMIVDDNVAFVEPLNWETKNLTKTRDYAVVTRVAVESPRVSRPTGTASRSIRAPRRTWSGAASTAARASRTSSTTRRNRSGCRTSATRTR